MIAVGGPKGMAVAKELGDGVFSPVPTGEFGWSTVLTFGTVLDPGEDPGSERVLAAAGHGAAVAMHGAVEFGQIDGLPNGAAWLAAYDDVPAASRHLALHDGHLAGVNDRDRPFVTGEFLSGVGARPRRRRLARQARQGRGDGRHRRRLPASRPRRPPRARDLHGRGDG